MHGIETIITLQTLQNALNTLGYPAVVLFIFLESTGLPIPGETMLLVASFYAATSDRLLLPIIIACAALGAIMGDNLGYYIGRTGGRAFAERFGRYLFLKMEHLDKAEMFFRRHGPKTVFFGRFIALLRIWAAFLAGMNRMNWRTFLFYNAAGGIAWATLMGSLGYIAGRYFHDHLEQVLHLARTIGWIGLGAVALVALGAFVLVRVRRAHHLSASHTAESTEQELGELPAHAE
jgi:membrane protein DedA with SNARE-associated domain